MTTREDIQQKRQALLEGRKLFYDAFKHITTLSTGSILLLITFLDKVFKNPASLWLFVLSTISFVVSMTISVVVMMILAGAITNRGLEKEDRKMVTLVIGTAISSFFVGVIVFIIFALQNFTP